MFLAGLVVGAILSTVYFGYTSGQTGVGAGLKNLTRNFDDSHANPSPVARQATAPIVQRDLTDSRINTADITSGATLLSGDDRVSTDEQTATGTDNVAAIAPSGSDEQAGGEDDNDFDFYTQLPSGNALGGAGEAAVRESQLPSSATSALPQTAAITAAAANGGATANEGSPALADTPPASRRMTAVTPQMNPTNQTDQDIAQQAGRTLTPSAEVTSLPVARTAALQTSRTTGSDERSVDSGMTRKGQYYMLQLAAYPSYDKADGLKAKLALQGVQALIQRAKDGEQGYRVSVGPFIRYQRLENAERKLIGLGLTPKKLLMKKTRS